MGINKMVIATVLGYALLMANGIGHIACLSHPSCVPINDYVYSPGCKGVGVVIELHHCAHTVLIALVDQREFYFSSNLGKTWQRSDEATLYPFGLTDCGCHPANNEIRYRVINENGMPFPVAPDYIERTSDGGKTWVRKASILNHSGDVIRPRGNILYDPKDPNTIYMGPVMLNHDPKQEALCVSHDGGDTFEVVLKISGCDFAVSQSKSNVLYVADDECNVYKTEDAGKTWGKVMSGSEMRNKVIENSLRKRIINQANEIRGAKCRALSIDPQNADVAYVVTDYGILKTVDGGKEWCGLDVAGFAGSIYQLLIDGSDSRRLFVGTECGLYESLNEGASWRKIEVRGR